MERFLNIMLFHYFPDNPWLRKHRWHRLAMVFAGSFTTLSLIMSILLVFFLIDPFKYYLTQREYRIKDNITGKTVVVTANHAPTEQDKEEIFNKTGLRSTTTTRDDFIKESVRVGTERGYTGEDMANRLDLALKEWDTTQSKLDIKYDWIPEKFTLTNPANLYIMMIIFLVISMAYTIPSTTYRLILFILVGNKWKSGVNGTN